VKFGFIAKHRGVWPADWLCEALGALPRDAREQVEAGLHRYAMTGQGDVKALRSRDGYRLRVGSYRVIFDEDATTILAIYIGRRATSTYKRN
jgi:mRNA interferase RelE/StbE